LEENDGRTMAGGAQGRRWRSLDRERAEGEERKSGDKGEEEAHANSSIQGRAN
jgi:hypothetical protein